MRHVLAAASLLALAAACSSSDEDECPIVGTYSMTGEIETTTCVFPDAPASAASTIQISAAEPGSGADFLYTVQGTTGRCPLSRVGTCKVEGTCPLTVFDATTANNQGSVQASWTFTKSGFSGVTGLTLPPFKDNPQGCVQTAKNTATRR